MKSRVLSFILSVSFLTCTVMGCGSTEDTGNEINVSENNCYTDMAAANAQFSESLIGYIEEYGYRDKNYMISPTSLRAAIVLAALGADGRTKEGLLGALNFEDMDDAFAWYDNVRRSVDLYDEWITMARNDKSAFRYYDGKEDEVILPDGDFTIQNSIWRNIDIGKALNDDYIKDADQKFSAHAQNEHAGTLTYAVNRWVEQNTNGFIPKVCDDLSSSSLVLVNTLYLRTDWTYPFNSTQTREGDFHALSGVTVRKDFMSDRNILDYYEDDEGKAVILPLKGGLKAVFVIGNVDVSLLCEKAFPCDVNISIPKFSLETSLSNDELVNFCIARGAGDAFAENADFSLMSNDDTLYISDIIQKTKICVNEKGIEAAAATFTNMYISTDQMPAAAEFIADVPFSYMILTEGDVPEMLFYGQVVE